MQVSTERSQGWLITYANGLCSAEMLYKSPLVFSLPIIGDSSY